MECCFGSRVEALGSFYFAGYEWAKRRLPNPDSFVGQVVCGVFGATVSSALTNPLDVVKTRLQTDLSYRGVGDVVMRTMRDEGPRAFHRGLVARILWLAPGCAISVAVFEQCKRWLATT